MNESSTVFGAVKRFIGFDAGDIDNLRALAPIFAADGPALTDAFYERLGAEPTTAALIAGRVDALKATHARWMAGLFAGEYGDDYLADRLRIGQVHVRVGVPPWWVEAVFSFLRGAGVDLLDRRVPDPERRGALICSFFRILDLDLLLINLAYGEERLDRLCAFTGMSRTLLERCVDGGRRK